MGSVNKISVEFNSRLGKSFRQAIMQGHTHKETEPLKSLDVYVEFSIFPPESDLKSQQIKFYFGKYQKEITM